MKQKVQVIGMTCQNCRRGVAEKMGAMPGLTGVEVSLEKAQASFESPKSISPEAIEKVLGPKYTVHSMATEVKTAGPSKLAQLRPLFLILGYVTVGSLLLSKLASLALFMTYFMGLFYLVFGFFKFLDYKGFPASFAQYDPIAKRLKFYGWIYPFIETALGLAFLYQFELSMALWTTLVILGSTTLGVIKQLRQKSTIQCACLGTALNLPMTEATLIENSIMLLMALGMLLGMV